MPKLQLIEDNKTVSSFDLSDGEIMIGRDDQCEIPLDDEAISRQHVRIFTLMGDAFLEDMGSSNGTYVNGQLSRKCALNDGDVIQIGKKELRFSHPPEARQAGQNTVDLDATQIIPPGEFGPETKAVKQEKRSREGISPVILAARETTKPEVKQRVRGRQTESRGFWGWLRRLFS